MSRSRFVDTRAAMRTTLGKALEQYEREISEHKKGPARKGVESGDGWHIPWQRKGLEKSLRLILLSIVTLD